MSLLKSKRQKKYNLSYYQYLPWSKARWVVQTGDLVKLDDQTYKVTKVVKFPIPGKLPQISIEPIEPID